MLQQIHQHIQGDHDAHLQRTVHAIEDVIDAQLFPNLSALDDLICEATDPKVRATLTVILQRTRAAMRALGNLQTRVRPGTLDDPLGLPHVFQVLVEDIWASAWPGRCQFDIEGDQVAIAPAAQHEVHRIAREVLGFVVHQPAAEAVHIYLKYPSAPGDPIQFTISWIDRQTTEPSTTSKQYMEQCVRVMGGHIAWHHEPTLGCSLRVTFPASLAFGLQ